VGFAVLSAALFLLATPGIAGQSEASPAGNGVLPIGLVIESTPNFAGATEFYDAAGEATRDNPDVGYNEIGFGARLTARREGLGYVRVAWTPGWIPGAVLFSGYEKDAKRVSDPWSDVHLAVGVELIGSESSFLESRALYAALGPTVTIPPGRPDYAEQSEAQEAGELYIAHNQGLKAWALGLESTGSWNVPFALSEADDWRLLWKAAWDRYLPMPYEASSLEAYRRNELRGALGDAAGVGPHEKIDYRNRLSGTVGAATTWRLGSFLLGGGANLRGWVRQAPAVDGTVVTNTGAAGLAAGVALDAAYELFPGGALGLRFGGSVSVAGRNTPQEVRAWTSAYLRLGAEPASTSIY
jgi:hypothetical protein